MTSHMTRFRDGEEAKYQCSGTLRNAASLYHLDTNNISQCISLSLDRLDSCTPSINISSLLFTLSIIVFSIYLVATFHSISAICVSLSLALYDALSCPRPHLSRLPTDSAVNTND